VGFKQAFLLVWVVLWGLQSAGSGDDDGALCGLEDSSGMGLGITDSVVVSPATNWTRNPQPAGITNRLKVIL